MISYNSTSPDEQSPSRPGYDMPIPVHYTYQRPSIPPTAQARRSPYHRTIRRDNRAVQALSLPNIMVANHRSIFPKFEHLVDELLEMDMHLGLHCETWEDSENTGHSNKIEEAFEIHGIQYISTPRQNKRGGGTAITLVSSSPFNLTKLEPSVESHRDKVEVCWGLLKPKVPTGRIKSIIVCAFYLPPHSRKKSALISHISLNYFVFKSTFPDSAVLIGGDKNDLDLKLLLDIDPSLKQLVTLPTHRQSVLDIIVTDLGQFYNEPIIRPPLQPDNPDTACPSDHNIVFVTPNTNSCLPVKRETTVRITRPLPVVALNRFANWIQHESWTFVYDGADPTDMAARLTFLLDLKIDQCCPARTIKSTNLDGKVRSVTVAQACRKKKREYEKHGNSEKFKRLKKEAKAALKLATTNFIKKQVEMATKQNNSWFQHVKRTTARPGDTTSSSFTLPKHIEDNLTSLESSNRICEFFSAISKEYTPIDIENLPERVKTKLSSDPCNHPYLTDQAVYEGLRKGKKTCSVPGDIPTKLLEEFLPELTAPVAAIYRAAIETHTWPDSYKKEHHLPINKVPYPQSEDDLRNLGLTPYFSKRLEWFLIQWIWPYISPHIDPDQLGGLPGCSVNHYLVLMIDFISKKLDAGQRNPTAVLACLVDFSKAFNRMDHNILATILSDLNVPTCALKLIISYLSNRKMCVRYNGASSNDQHIPGGGPQGGLLTVILFNLQVNRAGAPCPLFPLPQVPPQSQGPVLHPQPLQAGPLPICHQQNNTLKKKYVDDLSLLESIDLKTKLIKATPTIGPPNIHEQPGLILPPDQSVLQHQLQDLLSFTDENGMKINTKKTKIIPFNVSKKFDFLPQINFPGYEALEVTYTTKLLGVTLTSDLSWTPHVVDITTRATKKLWILVRFKLLGGTRDQLVTVYQLRVRSTLEFASPVFHSGLSQEQSRRLEMVQKKACAIILGKDYVSYENALTTLNLERLNARRTALTLDFAIKCSKSPKHSHFFPLNNVARENNRNTKKYKEFQCRTSRYYNSPVPYMARLLNNENLLYIIH